MNTYRIKLVDENGNIQIDHMTAKNAQECADKIRADWKDCYICWIALEVDNWK